MRKHRMLTVASVASAALAFVVLACAPAEVEPSMQPLDGRDWTLAALRGAPTVRDSVTSRVAMLRFDADSGRVYGSGGCNRISGPYTLVGDTLTFGPIVSTMMACVDERVGRQEFDFLAALDSTRGFRIDADTLTLIGSEGELATLLAAPDE